MFFQFTTTEQIKYQIAAYTLPVLHNNAMTNQKRWLSGQICEQISGKKQNQSNENMARLLTVHYFIRISFIEFSFFLSFSFSLIAARECLLE